MLTTYEYHAELLIYLLYSQFKTNDRIAMSTDISVNLLCEGITHETYLATLTLFMWASA